MRKPIVLVGAIVLLGIGAVTAQQITTEQQLAREYAAARASAERQEWQPAVNGFERIISVRSNYRDAASRLVEVEHELHLAQEYDAALASYRAANWPQAVQQLDVLAAESPGYKDVDARVADARRQLGFQQQDEQARASLKANDFPAAIGALEALSASDYTRADQARADLAQARRAYADVLVQKATRADDARDWAGTEQLARLALQQNPDVASAARLLGHSLSKQARYMDARQVLSAATTRDPRDAEAFNLLGWAHLNGSGGDLALADRSFRQAMQLDSHLANAYAGLGELQLKRAQRDEAQASFDAALALDATQAAAHQGLGLLAMDNKEYAAAVDHFRAAILNESEEVQFHLDLERALVGQGDLDGALAELESTRQAHPDRPDVDAAFGDFYSETKQYSDAVAAYDTAIGVRPDVADYHLGRGFALFQLQRYSEALQEGDRAVELAEVSDGHLLRGYALLGLQQFADAEAAARQALDADPSNTAAQELLKVLARRAARSPSN